MYIIFDILYYLVFNMLLTLSCPHHRYRHHRHRSITSYQWSIIMVPLSLIGLLPLVGFSI
jgi:hypothetical protein